MKQFNEMILHERMVVVQCRTEQQARELLAWAHSKGKKWCNGESFLNNTLWEVNGFLTCYNVWFGEVGSKIAFTTHSPRCVLSFEEVLLDED